MTDQHHDAPSLLIAAADAIGERAELRDQPTGERSMARAVAAFNSLHGTQLTELQGWQFMVLLKLARSTGGRTHADDYIDAAGYAALAGECALHGQGTSIESRAAAEWKTAVNHMLQMPPGAPMPEAPVPRCAGHNLAGDRL